MLLPLVLLEAAAAGRFADIIGRRDNAFCKHDTHTHTRGCIGSSVDVMKVRRLVHIVMVDETQ